MKILIDCLLLNQISLIPSLVCFADPALKNGLKISQPTKKIKF